MSEQSTINIPFQILSGSGSGSRESIAVVAHYCLLQASLQKERVKDAEDGVAGRQDTDDVMRILNIIPENDDDV